jgi:cation transport ATPase
MIPRINDTIEQVDAVVETTNKAIAPIRQSVFKRFPGFFTLLVTFGVAATFFAIERILATTPIFNEHPWYTLMLGILILVVTGKLYAKLG